MECRLYLVVALELLTVEVKVSAEGSHGEEGAQQCGLIGGQHVTGRVVLMLLFQLGQRT